jgi:hypothetical protein
MAKQNSAASARCMKRQDSAGLGKGGERIEDSRLGPLRSAVSMEHYSAS